MTVQRETLRIFPPLASSSQSAEASVSRDSSDSQLLKDNKLNLLQSQSILQDLVPVSVYYIKVATSNVSNAGTDADVYIIIHGEAGISAPTLLDNPSRDDFERGAVDDFRIDSKDVGAVTGLEVKFNNTKNRPSWAFDYIDVKGSNDTDYARFNFSDWLEADRWIKFTLYDIKVATSDESNAGTNANVFIKIHGSEGVTTALLLDDPSRGDFEEGAVDNFLRGAIDVGVVTGVEVKHDNTTDSANVDPSWAFVYIKVKRSNDSNYVDFNFSDWLEPDRWIKFTLLTFFREVLKMLEG
ncbi:lipoxygenase homology domain-containing protein 1-like [Porites lutea]|uniref:lipoxygenase homology domain-containing protein 1-like n=1 Tax=Porites lutea TaxID=51062 RepID=UPI003CC6C6FF